MTNVEPLDLSVVIPCYNCAETIERTLNSVRAQSVKTNIIVVNDGSKDSSKEYISTQKDVHLIMSARGRQNIARNKGLDAVQTPFTVFLDADDEVEGELFASALEVAKINGADAVFSPMRMVLRGKTCAFHPGLGLPCKDAVDVVDSWLQGHWLNPSAMLWRTEAIKSIGGWSDHDYDYDDMELTLRAVLNNLSIWENTVGAGVYHRGIKNSITDIRSKVFGPHNYYALISLLIKYAEAFYKKGDVFLFYKFRERIHLLSLQAAERGADRGAQLAFSFLRNKTYY